MVRAFVLPLVAGLSFVVALVAPVRADFPKPSPYPISWELTFTHQDPKRIVVQSPGDANPQPYWYMIYHVANNTDQDKIEFFPTFQLETQNGDIQQSDDNIPPAVFQSIKSLQRMPYLQDANHIDGELRQGEDSSRDGVAIWREPEGRMGTFTIFVSGFWGESAVVKVGNKDVTLHKTLELVYHLDSDSNDPTQGTLREISENFVMR